MSQSNNKRSMYFFLSPKLATGIVPAFNTLWFTKNGIYKSGNRSWQYKTDHLPFQRGYPCELNKDDALDEGT